MVSRLAVLLSIFALSTAQNQCTSLSTLVHDTTGAPSGLAIPDCSYITANSAAICNTLGSWDIINANTCYLKGPGYGCTIVNGQFSTNEMFYCNVGPVVVPTSSSTNTPLASRSPAPTHSVSAGPTKTPSATLSVSGSPSASPSVSASPSASPSVSGSSLATSSTTATITPSSTNTLTATPSSTNTLTATPSFTPVPSTNITVIYLSGASAQEQYATPGVIAAITLAAIFGTLVICTACAAALLRRAPQKQDEIVRQLTIVAERRPSSAPLSRRPSMIVREVTKESLNSAV